MPWQRASMSSYVKKFTTLRALMSPNCLNTKVMVACITDEMYVVNEEDKQRVMAELTRQGKNYYEACTRAFLQKRVRRMVPQPGVLEQRIGAVLQAFAGMSCPVTNKSPVSPQLWEAWRLLVEQPSGQGTSVVSPLPKS